MFGGGRGQRRRSGWNGSVAPRKVSTLGEGGHNSGFFFLLCFGPCCLPAPSRQPLFRTSEFVSRLTSSLGFSCHDHFQPQPPSLLSFCRNLGQKKSPCKGNDCFGNCSENSFVRPGSPYTSNVNNCVYGSFGFGIGARDSNHDPLASRIASESNRAI